MTDKQLTVQCIQMLERYTGVVKALPNSNERVAALKAADMTVWNQTYHPQLVKNGKIRDGAFAGEELCHFLFRLYRQAYIMLN